MAPEPLDPLDRYVTSSNNNIGTAFTIVSLYSVLASQYHESRAVYEARAAELTEKYAKKIGWSEMRKVSETLL